MCLITGPPTGVPLYEYSAKVPIATRGEGPKNASGKSPAARPLVTVYSSALLYHEVIVYILYQHTKQISYNDREHQPRSDNGKRSSRVLPNLREPRMAEGSLGCCRRRYGYL